MTAPIASQLIPVDGETIADLDRVSIVWSGAGGDPVDTTQFEFLRGMTSLSTSFTPLGGDNWQVFAEAGLFPDEVNVQVTAKAKSIGGTQATSVRTFSTRTSMQFTTPYEFLNRASYVFSFIQLEAFIASIGVIGTQLNFNVRPNVAGDELIAFQIVKMFGSADLGKMKISATRQIIQLLGINAQGIGIPTEGFGENAKDIHPIVKSSGLNTLTLVAEDERPLFQTLEALLPFEDLLVLQTLVSGIEKDSIAIVAIDISSGDGIVIFVDLIDAGLVEVGE